MSNAFKDAFTISLREVLASLRFQISFNFIPFLNSLENFSKKLVLPCSFFLLCYCGSVHVI